MSFGNKEILIARYNEQASLFANMDKNKIEEIGLQVSDLIFQRTGITPPENPDEAPPILRGIWCDIVLFKFIPYQKGLSDEEKSRRSRMSDDAMNLLIEIGAGDLKIKNSNGDLISNSSETIPLQINSTKRITGVI